MCSPAPKKVSFLPCRASSRRQARRLGSLQGSTSHRLASHRDVRRRQVRQWQREREEGSQGACVEPDERGEQTKALLKDIKRLTLPFVAIAQMQEGGAPPPEVAGEMPEGLDGIPGLGGNGGPGNEEDCVVM